MPKEGLNEWPRLTAVILHCNFSSEGEVWRAGQAERGVTGNQKGDVSVLHCNFSTKEKFSELIMLNEIRDSVCLESS